MPYIKQEDRPKLDIIVEEMGKQFLSKSEIVEILFLFVKYKFIKPSYNFYKNYCGELDQCYIEIVRRERQKNVRYVPTISYRNFLIRNDVVDDLIELLAYHPIVANGDLNYLLFKFYKKYVQTIKNAFSNHHVDEYLSALALAKAKVETYLLAPYEDEKIKENGDVD